MNTRPRLIRSLPFWALIVGSLAAALGGTYLLFDTLGGMDARLLDGSATTSDVYVGQIWAVLGTVLIGAGVIGLLLALTVASLRAFAPTTPVAEASTPEDEVGETAVPAAAAGEELGYQEDLGHQKADTVAAR